MHYNAQNLEEHFWIYLVHLVNQDKEETGI